MNMGLNKQACVGVSSLEGCGNCTYSISDPSFIELLDPASIISLFDQLIEARKSFRKHEIVLNASTITCTGDIIVQYNSIDKRDSIAHTRNIYFSIINKWLQLNLSQIYETIDIIYLIICASVLYYDDDEQRACKVLDNLESIVAFINKYINSIS